jgi:hypothetical protein
MPNVRQSENMAEAYNPSATAPTANKPSLTLPRPVRWLRETIALVVWLAAFAQLFIMDLSSHLASRVPGLELLLKYRSLTLLGTIAALWLILGNRRFFLFVGYILAYPFVGVFWHIPRLLFRSWAVVVAFSPAAHSILSSFRMNFVLFSAALIASFVICISTSPPFVIVAMAILGLYLVVHFVRRFRVAFSSTTVFADVSGAIRKAWGGVNEWGMAKRPQGLNPESNEYRQALAQNLLQMYAMTTLLYIFGERLREVINSRKLDLYFLGSLLYTFVLTSIVFGVEYCGLERVSPGSFVGADRGLLGFLGLSFSTLMTSDISPLRPGTAIAQAGLYAQLLASLLIVVLLVFVILTSIRERYKQDLDGLVVELGDASTAMGNVLEANYELTLTATESWLLEVSPDVTKWIFKIRHGVEPPRAIADANDGPVP